MKLFNVLLGIILILMCHNISLAQTPIADYSFDVDASDATGNFNGTLEGDAAIVTDATRGQVLSLTTDGYVSVPTAVAATMENWSFTAWVDFGGTNSYPAIMAMGNATNGNTPYCDFHIQSNGTLSFYVSEADVWPGDGSAQICDKTLMDIDPGWVHLALTFTLGSGPLFYINGEVQTSTDWNSSNDHDVSPQLLADILEVIYIGKDTFNQQTLTNTKIDEAKFFNTALTAEQVVDIYNGVSVGIEDKPQAVASRFELAQNYPNPFNPCTTIEYTLENNTQTEITVYDLLGHKIVTLVDGYQDRGTHKVLWDASDVSAGVYVYQIRTEDFIQSKKMILVK